MTAVEALRGRKSANTKKVLATRKCEGNNVERRQPERQLPHLAIVEHRADQQERQKKYLTAESDQLN